MSEPQGFNASCFQIRYGYKYLYKRDIPDDLSFDAAARELVRDFGLARVQAILTGIPNVPDTDSADAFTAAKASDPAICSIFQANSFDLMNEGVYCQELSHLQHSLGITAVGRMITIKGNPDQHFRLEKVDWTPAGDVGGWWYFEIGGPFKVLIIND